MNSVWICTDEDENQWGRELSEFKFEFKQSVTLPNQLPKMNYQTEINLEEYTLGEIEDAINAYGYSLHPLKEGKFRYIYEESTNPYFLIAEMLFEYELLEYL
jgi:hypothetical protein